MVLKMAKQMSMSSRVLISILGGVLVTLLTGLLPTTPSMLVGATWYGFPLAWLIRMVVAPEYNPWRIEVLNFFADMVIWFVIVAIVVFVVERLRRSAAR